MKLLDRLKRRSKEQWYVVIILFIAVMSRAVGLGHFPGGVNVDEAYSGYEAWAMLHYGMDSWGIHNPVYLTVWGSGMSVLDSVLMMPFIKLWGLNAVTIRLPQMIVGVLSVYVFYLLLKEITSKRMAILGMFFLAICPWHIMMSRWGMDCNMAPGFLLFAVYFFIKGLEKERYFLLSAFFWGLSLYCYATVWVLVPIVILLWGIYGLIYKKMKCSKYVIASCVILFIMALPLLLFVAVNMGWIPEIKTAFLSIPRLVEFRSDELGIHNILNNIKALFRLLIRQEDGLLWNSVPYFGMYYLISLPFIVIGFVLCVQRSVRYVMKKNFGYECLLLIWIAVAALTGILQGININKVNYIHIPMVVLWTEGVWWLGTKGKTYIGRIVIAVYAVFFLGFEGYYYTSYQKDISERQLSGADRAIETALQLREKNGIETIMVPNVLRHSQVLFYTEWPLENYLETVKWQEYRSRWLKTDSFGCFVWIREEETGNIKPDKDKIYLITKDEAEEFEREGFRIEIYEHVGVAYFPKG